MVSGEAPLLGAESAAKREIPCDTPSQATAVREVMLKALAQEANDRYDTAAEFRDELAVAYRRGKQPGA